LSVWFPHFQQLLQLFLWGEWLRAGCRTAPLQFLRLWNLKGWPNRVVSSIFSVCLHILQFLDIRMFEFQFELWVHQIHFRIFGGKHMQAYWRCGSPETMSYLIKCTVHLGVVSAYGHLDLDFRWGQ
jgi:hypothetical protein